MKEPHRKGAANRSNPESCAGGGNIAGEAMTGAHAGQPLNSEITSNGVPTLSPEGEGHTVDSVTRELPADAAESETLRMHGNSMHGNRETLETPTPGNARRVVDGRGRSEKALRRTTDMHVFWESDGPIVPKKRANKAGPTAAESVEGRGPAKGNASRTLLGPDTVPGNGGIGSLRVRVVARRTSRRAVDRHYPRQEPYEVVPHVRIRAGGAGQPASLPRLP